MVPRAAWTYPAPAADFLEGLIAFRWDALDEWFAEAEQLFGHPKDPYSRIDVCAPPATCACCSTARCSPTPAARGSSTRPRCRRAGTCRPATWTLDRLVPSGHLTRCAYKGAASYWHVRVGGELVEDLVWSYPDPEHDARAGARHVCFFSEKVDIELDGVVEERPQTQWSPSERSGAAALRGLMGRPDA